MDAGARPGAGRLAPFAVLAALALAAALAAPRGAADAQSPPAAGGTSAVATTLRPGWNMAAWLGPDAPARAIFGEIPRLVRVQAWDSAEGRYRIANRRSIPAGGLERLATGMGLWLWLGGGEAFEWRRAALEGGAPLDLRAGRHLVGWAGYDGASAAAALAPLGGALARAERWNAETQRYDRYRPGAPDDANTLRVLRRGDALAVELTSDARWRQPETATRVEFRGGVPETDRERIRGWIDRARAAFAGRWGVEAPAAFVVGNGAEALAPAYLEARGRTLPAGFCADYGGGAVFALADCLSGRLVAREYFRAVRDALDGAGSPASAAWLTEGMAEYAARLGSAAPSGIATLMDRERGLAVSRLARRAALPPLSGLETREAFAAHGEAASDLAFVAVEWLVGFFSEEAMLRYFRQLASAADWRAAFGAAFGFAAGDFLAAFEAYRAAVAPPLPHLVDGGGGPALSFAAGTPDAERASVRAALASAGAFYASRFGTPEPEFSLYAGPDAASVAAAHRLAFGMEQAEGFCHAASGDVSVVALDCAEAARSLDWHYGVHVRAALAPREALPEAAGGLDPRGPEWLQLGVAEYARAAYRAAAGIEAYGDARHRHLAGAARIALPLRALASPGNADVAGPASARALAFLAAERLAVRAGEQALFAYYAALPDASGWREAFEAAFGLGAEAFLADFEAHRARVAPPLPHLTDGRTGPALAFAGGVSGAARAAVRAELARVRAFFASRFGASEPEFTIYAGPDAEALAATHLRAFGEEIEGGFRDRAADDGAVSLVALDGAASRPYRLDWHYGVHALAALAPRDALPPAPEGRDRGPEWLSLGAAGYAQAAYRDAAGVEAYGDARRRHAGRAASAAAALGAVETQAGADAAGSGTARALGFLAAERLAALAGPALFEYYRLLPAGAGWREAFEAAFGIAPAAFYADFEAYRAIAAPGGG